MTAPAIIVYSLDQVTAALSAAGDCGREVIILSAPDAAASMGPVVFQSMMDLAHQEFPAVPFVAALDCGANAGHALAAIRQGIRAVVLSDAGPARARVADIARQNDVCLLPAAVYGGSGILPPLDLMSSADPLAACREFLHIEGATPMPEHLTSP